ncbi:MAG TPA: cation diffusion facilitator family transporter [Thermoleophilia bacterium]|nr:cation diffusion facilitator family transporter [Thermoleophilia bacterium]
MKARAAWLSIGSNSTLIVFKLVVGLVSGSISIISEALHSSSDLVASVIALFAVRSAAQPADRSHHFGHEKVENVSGVVEGLLILAAAVVIIFEAITKLLQGVHLDHVPLAIAVMLVSAGTNLGVSRGYLYPVARRTDSAALEADAAHLLTDVYTSLGVAGGLALVELTGVEALDPLVAIAVALLITWTSWRLVSHSTRVLLDEALPDDEVEDLREAVAEHRGELIVGYHKLRTRRAGSKRHIDLHITVPDQMTIAEAHEVADHIEADIAERLPNCEVLVHIEPSIHDREDDS